jgi:hypothetical protein
VETSLGGPWCMNLKSVGCFSFFSVALLGSVEVVWGAWAGVVLRGGVVLPLGNRDCLNVFIAAVLVSIGARRVGDLGATEMYSRRS